MYTGINEEICKKAWNIALGVVRRAHYGGVTNKDAGTIVVLNPHTGRVLFQDQVNPNHESADKYDEVALAKAGLTWRTKLPSRVVQQNAPHLYKPGDTKWGGSVIQDGLVVAFSGVQAVFDEAIAATMLAWIIAICQDEMTKQGGVMDSVLSFLTADSD